MAGDTLDDAISYVRSVAIRFSDKGTYSIGAIRQVMETYLRVDNETYWDFACRFMTEDEIEREWKIAVR